MGGELSGIGNQYSFTPINTASTQKTRSGGALIEPKDTQSTSILKKLEEHIKSLGNNITSTFRKVRENPKGVFSDFFSKLSGKSTQSELSKQVKQLQEEAKRYLKKADVAGLNKVKEDLGKIITKATNEDGADSPIIKLAHKAQLDVEDRAKVFKRMQGKSTGENTGANVPLKDHLSSVDPPLSNKIGSASASSENPTQGVSDEQSPKVQDLPPPPVPNENETDINGAVKNGDGGNVVKDPAAEAKREAALKKFSKEIDVFRDYAEKGFEIESTNTVVSGISELKEAIKRAKDNHLEGSDVFKRADDTLKEMKGKASQHGINVEASLRDIEAMASWRKRAPAEPVPVEEDISDKGGKPKVPDLPPPDDFDDDDDDDDDDIPPPDLPPPEINDDDLPPPPTEPAPEPPTEPAPEIPDDYNHR